MMMSLTGSPPHVLGPGNGRKGRSGAGVRLNARQACPRGIRDANGAPSTSTASTGWQSKVTAVARLPALRRAATLVAFVHSLEASAQDDALEVLDRLLRDIFGAAEKADRKARLRSLKDLDALALTLAHACAALLDPALPDNVLRDHVFARVPRVGGGAADHVSNAWLRAHSRFPGHALTPTGVMAIRCKQFHLPDL